MAAAQLHAKSQLQGPTAPCDLTNTAQVMTTHTNTSVLCRSCKPNPVGGREDSDTLGGSPQKLQRQVVITIHFTCR